MAGEQVQTVLELMRAHSTHPHQRAAQEWIEDVIDNPRPRGRTPIDVFNFGPRKSLTELRPRHLVWVAELVDDENYDRSKAHDYLIKNYNRLFGHLRFRKAAEVPSDRWRKMIIISRLLDIAETRKLEIAEDREKWDRWVNKLPK
jgi:hypothetical protein